MDCDCRELLVCAAATEHPSCFFVLAIGAVVHVPEELALLDLLSHA